MSDCIPICLEGRRIWREVVAYLAVLLFVNGRVCLVKQLDRGDVMRKGEELELLCTVHKLAQHSAG